MDELQQLYDSLYNDGYVTISFDEFKNLYENKPGYKDKVVSVLERDNKTSYLSYTQPDIEKELVASIQKNYQQIPKIQPTPLGTENISQGEPTKQQPTWSWYKTAEQQQREIGTQGDGAYRSPLAKPFIPQREQANVPEVLKPPAVVREEYKQFKEAQQERAFKLQKDIADAEKKSFQESVDENKKWIESNAVAQQDPNFLASLEGITPGLIGNEEADVVNTLTKTLSKYGFTFQPTGIGDALLVRTADGLNEIEIDLDPFFSSTENSESEKLKKFIKANAQPAVEYRGEDFISKASRAKAMRDKGMVNDDGSFSTVKFAQYEQDGKFYVVPTLFPKDPFNYGVSKNDWMELPLEDAIKVATSRGEIFEFNNEKDAKDFSEGAWKDVDAYDVEGEKFYKERGLDYYNEKKKWREYTNAQDEIELIDKITDSPGTITTQEKERFKKYFSPDGRPLYGSDKLSEFRGTLEETRDNLQGQVFDASFFKSDGTIQKAREDFDFVLAEKQSKLVREAVDVNKKSKAFIDELNEFSLTRFNTPIEYINNIVPKTEEDAVELDVLKQKYVVAKTAQKDAAFKFEMGKTYYNAKWNKEATTEYDENISGFINAVSDAWNNGQAAEAILSATLGIDDMDNLEDRQEVARKIVENLSQLSGKQSKIMSRINLAREGEFSKAFFADPFEAMVTLVGTTIAQMAPIGFSIIPKTVAAGASAGAAIGAASGSFAFGVGAVPGAIGGATTGAGYGLKTGIAATSFAVEYTNAIFDAMREKGYDLLDPNQVEAALMDDAVWETGGQIGVARGIPIAIADYLSAGLAGRVFKVSKLASTPVKIAAQVGERMVFDPLAEGFGEYAAQVSAGQGINMNEVVMESLGGFGSKTTPMAVNLMKEARNNTSIKVAHDLTNIQNVAKETVSDERISQWANNMHQLGKIDADVNQRIQENVGLRRQAREVLSVDGTKPKSTKAEARAMELLSAREMLSRTPNLKQINSRKISQINEELAAMGETKDVVDADKQVNLDAVLGTTRQGVSHYQLNGKILTKDKFLEAVNNMTDKQLAKAKYKVSNDTETQTTINNKVNAIQKQSAGAVPVQPKAGVSETVEEGKPKAEPQVAAEEVVQEEVTQATDEIVSSKTRLDEIADVLPEKVAYTAADLDNFASLEQDKAEGVLSGLADKVASGIALDDKEQIVYDNNKQRVDELSDLASEKIALEESVSDLEALISESQPAPAPDELEKFNQSIGRVKEEVDTDKDEQTLSDLGDKIIAAKKAIATADDTDAAIEELKKSQKEKDDFEKSIQKRKDFDKVNSLIEDEIDNSKKDNYEYQGLFNQDPRLAAIQSAKDMLEFAKENKDFLDEKRVAVYENDIKMLEEDIAKFPVKERKVEFRAEEGMAPQAGNVVVSKSESTNPSFEDMIDFNIEGGKLEIGKVKGAKVYAVTELKVDEDKRKQGIATKLLQMALDETKGELSGMASNDMSVGLNYKLGMRAFDSDGKELSLEETKKARAEKAGNSIRMLLPENQRGNNYKPFSTKGFELKTKEEKKIPKFARNLKINITPATVRLPSQTPKMIRIQELTKTYNEKLSSYKTSKDKRVLEELKDISAQILDEARKEVVDNLIQIKGVSIKFDDDLIGYWDNAFEPSFNMTISITPQADTQKVSDFITSFAEKYSQDAFIVEDEASNQDVYWDGIKEFPLGEEGPDGLSYFPQLQMKFKEPLTDEQVADLADELKANGVPGFSLNNNELTVSIFPYISDDELKKLPKNIIRGKREQQYREISESTKRAIGKTLGPINLDRATVKIRRSAYTESTTLKAKDTRQYNKSDVLEKFQKAITYAESLTEELNKLRNKEIELSKEKKKLSKTEKERLDELISNVRPFMEQTFENNKSLYEEAKSEIEKIASEVIRGINGFVSEFPIKKSQRATTKTIRWYNSFTEELGDGARVNIILKDPNDLDRVFDEINKKFPTTEKSLRRINETTDLGYPKRLIEIRTSNGIIAELQVMTPQSYLAKDGVGGFIGRESYASKEMDKIKKRMGWDIPDGLGHYFYEIQRDWNIEDSLREQATELSKVYYDAMTNPNVILPESFMDDVIDFKLKVDNADKTNWDEGNTGKSPESLIKYVKENPDRVEAVKKQLVIENVVSKVSEEFDKQKSIIDEINKLNTVHLGLSQQEFITAISKINISNAIKLINFLNLSFPNVIISITKADFDNVMSQIDTTAYVKGDQVIYGVTKDGEIYINPDVHNSQSELFNTAIHEFGHVWTDYLRTTEKGNKIYNKGISLIEEGINVDKKLKAMFDEQMQKFDGDKARALNEMVAILIGDKGESIANASIKSKFKEFLSGMWNYIKSKFKMSEDLTEDEIQNMNLDTFLGTALADIFSGKEISLTEAQKKAIKNPDAMFSSTQSMNSIISQGRANGFSDAAIKQVLINRGFKASDVNAALAVQVDVFTELPREFANVDGGVVQGMQLFNEVKTELNNWANTAQDVTYGEMRQKAMDLMKANPIFQAQPDTTQMELLSAFDRTLNTRANVNVQRQITQIKNNLRQRKIGANELQQAKIVIKNLIRSVLPKSSTYTQAQINKLITIINNATKDSILADTEKVMSIVEHQREKMKNAVLKDMFVLVSKKANPAITPTGKRRAGGVDARGQAFFAAVKPILRAAIKNDINYMSQVANELAQADADGRLNEAIFKEQRGEPLTDKQQELLDKAYAFDTFADVLNMDLEEVQDLMSTLETARAEAIMRLKIRRQVRAAEYEAMNAQASAQVQELNPELFVEEVDANGNVKVRPKSKNELVQDRAAIRRSFQQGKIWSGFKQLVARWDYTTITGIKDFVRKRLLHLGALVDLFDNKAKGFTFFNDNVYRPLNRMDEQSKVGYFEQMQNLDVIANSINGITKGYKQIRSMLQTGVHEFTINGRTDIYNADKLLRIYALSKNAVQREKLKKMGWDDAQIDKIKTIVGPQAIEFTDKLVDYLSNDYYESINNVYSQVNDVNLGYVPNYFPTITESTKVNSKLLEDGDFNGIFNAETAPALKERTDTSGLIELNYDFTDVLESHIVSMEKYKAYAEGVRRLNALFQNPSVNVLLEESGLKSIVKRSVNFAITPNAGQKEEQTMLGRLMSKFTGFALAFKAIQIVKQATSFVNAYEDYNFFPQGSRVPGAVKGPINLLMFMVDSAKVIATMPKQIRNAYDMSANVRDRLEKGIEGDVYGLESGSTVFTPISKSNKLWARAARALKTIGAAPTVLGDILGVMGYMVNYNRNIANGMSKEDALEAFNNYNATAQSRRGTEKSSIQQNSSELARAFTMFGSTTFLQINKVLQSQKNMFQALAAGKMPESKDIRAFVINLGVANALFVGVSNLAKFIKGDDDDREEALKRMKEALLGLNLIESIPLVGAAVEEAKAYIEGEKSMRTKDVVNPYSQVFRKMKQGMDEGTVWGATRPLIEITIGAQLDPAIGLYNGFTEGFDEEAMYDVLGISKSYRPTQEKEGKQKVDKPMSKEDLKRYYPEMYEQMYGPGGAMSDVEELKKQQRKLKRDALREKKDMMYNYKEMQEEKPKKPKSAWEENKKEGGTVWDNKEKNGGTIWEKK